MSEAQAIGPTRDRLEIIDALRGFALFGILLANILYWSGWVLVTDTERNSMANGAAQLWQYRFHHLLIDGKFYSLFSLLFGAGFALQLARLERRGADGVRVYRRRILVLLAFGIAHSLFIWDGDILMLYALLGLLLPLFRSVGDRSLLGVSAAMIFVVPIAGATIVNALGWHPDRALLTFSDVILSAFGWRPGPDIALRLLSTAGWRDVAVWNIAGTAYSWGIRLESWRMPKVFGMMLLGLWVGRQLVAGRLLGETRLLKWTLAAGLGIGLPSSLYYAFVPGQGQSGPASMLGTVPLACAYAAAFVLAWPRARPILGLLAAPGRMALTNYLSHSLLGIIIFYGVGFGLIGRLPPLGFYGVAVAIFGAQIFVSNWWLRHHPQGPMEALWRRLTYAGLSPTGGAPATV